MQLSTSSLADYALVAKVVRSDGPTATLRGLGPMAPLEFLDSLFWREDLLFIFSKNIKLFPRKIIYIYIYI